MDAPMVDTPLSLAARSPLRDPLAAGSGASMIPRLTMQSPGVVPLVRYNPGPSNILTAQYQPLPMTAIQPSPGFSSLPAGPEYFDPLQANIGSRFSGLSREPLSQYVVGPPAATAIRVERPLSPVFEESPQTGRAEVSFGSVQLQNREENFLSGAAAKERLVVRLYPQEGRFHSILLLERKGGKSHLDSEVSRVLYLTVDIVGKNIKTGVNLVRYQPPKDPAAWYQVLVFAHPERIAPNLANQQMMPREIVSALYAFALNVSGVENIRIVSRWTDASDQEILDELRRRRLPLKAPINRENFLQQLWASEP